MEKEQLPTKKLLIKRVKLFQSFGSGLGFWSLAKSRAMFGANCAVDRWLRSLVIRQTYFNIWSKITLWNMEEVWVCAMVLKDVPQAPANLGMFARSSQRLCTTSKHREDKDITNAIMHCIAKDMLPINTVEKEGFKRLINLIDHRYVLPGRKHGTIFLQI